MKRLLLVLTLLGCSDPAWAQAPRFGTSFGREFPASASYTDSVRLLLNGTPYENFFHGLHVLYMPPGAALLIADTTFTITCTQDKTFDNHYCDMLMGTGEYLTVTKRRGSYNVRVGRQHDPGSQTTIRVDRLPPFVLAPEGWTGKNANVVLAALRRGQSLVSRYHRFPEDGYRESEFSLLGFTLAMQILDDLYARFLKEK